MIDAADPCEPLRGRALRRSARAVTGGEDDGGGAVGDRRAIVLPERCDQIRRAQQRLDVVVACELRVWIGACVATAARGHGGKVALAAAGAIEPRPRLQR